VTTETWRNRIVRTAEVDPRDLVAHDKNWRIHTREQSAALEEVLERFGWVGDIMVMDGTNIIIDGHERWERALANDQPKVPVRYVDLTTEETYEVLLTFDPIGAMAITDVAKFDDLMRQVGHMPQALSNMLTDVSEAVGLIQRDFEQKRESPVTPEHYEYSREIAAPVYEPSDVQPALTDLYDTSKTDALVSAIEADDSLTEGQRTFLKIAAQRHTVLRFDRIADYYAHTGKAMQRHMEDSALVIIDFQRAIELGYVNLTQRLALMSDALPDADEDDDGDFDES
jgi:hypothetical protein